MSNITSYPGIQLIANDDLMVISDVSEDGNPTRTVSIGTLSTVFEGGGSAGNILGIYPILVMSQGLNTTISIAGGVYQDKLTLTTNGTSGKATLSGSNLNIPEYSTGGGGEGGEAMDRFILTGMVKGLAPSEPMQFTSAAPAGLIPLWRTPIQARLELVTWAYMGDPLTFGTSDVLDFNIGVLPQGADAVIGNFSPINTMFSLGFTSNNTRPQGQLNVANKNIILTEFSNIAVIMDQRVGSTITPTDGDFAICLYFRNTSETAEEDPGESDRYRATLTDIIDNVVGDAGTYVIGGNNIGDFVQGANGQPWSFTNEVLPRAGYEVTNATATNPSGIINGADEDAINTVGGTVTETTESRFTVTMTPLVDNIVNNDGVFYTLTDDLDGATRTGLAGGIWSFSTGIANIPTTHYIDAFTATNPAGTFTADTSVQQTVGGEIKAKDAGGTDRYTVTLEPFNDNIVVPGDGGIADGPTVPGPTDPVYYTLGNDLAGATQTGTFGTPYAFNTTISLASGYEWRVQPTITNPSGTIPGNDISVAQTITGEIQESTTGKDQFTVTLNPRVDAITLPTADKGPTGPTSEYYNITGSPNGDFVTGPTGTNYTFNNGITMQSGWTIENFNPDNISGSIGTSDITRSKTITGQVVAEAQENVTVTYKLSDFIADTDPPHYTLTGDTDQDTFTGAPGGTYSFATGIQVDSGYSINNFSSTDPSGIIPASDISVNGSVTGTIVQDTEQTFTITSAWNDQITQASGFGPSDPAYTITGDVNGATVTGVNGTSYAFTNTVTANDGFTFTSGPAVSNPSGTIGNSNQTVQQIFTGVIVEDVVPPGDPGVVWRVIAPTGPGSGEVTSVSYTKTNGNTDTMTIFQNAGDQCICVLDGTTPVILEAGPGGGVEIDPSGATCDTTVNGITCPAGT
jgi:hypothetical protein